MKETKDVESFENSDLKTIDSIVKTHASKEYDRLEEAFSKDGIPISPVKRTS